MKMTKNILSAQEMKIHFWALNIKKKILYTFSSNSDIRWQASFANIKIHDHKNINVQCEQCCMFSDKELQEKSFGFHYEIPSRWFNH